MIWGALAITVAVWLGAIFYIVRGWEGSRRQVAKEVAIEAIPTEIKVSEPIPEFEEEMEIHIGEPPREETKPAEGVDIEAFYREFGRANIVEFPALNLSGIDVVDFAKNCYREIDFQCIDSVMLKEEDGRVYKVNIFDLLCDHYASSEDGFIDYFGQLKDRFASQIESISRNPDITPANRSALVGRYDLPQLVVWNDAEFFLVLVKRKDDTTDEKEINFLREFVIEKGLFKAKIFRITQRQDAKPIEAKPIEAKPIEVKPIEVKPIEVKPVEEIKPVEEARPVEEKPKKTRRRFTKEEIKFLKENKDKFTNEELAQKLDRSLDSVTHKLSRLGIARESYEWTKEKDDFLKKNISKLSYRELAEKLGTTIPSVRARCKKIKVKK